LYGSHLESDLEIELTGWDVCHWGWEESGSQLKTQPARRDVSSIYWLILQNSILLLYVSNSFVHWRGQLSSNFVWENPSLLGVDQKLQLIARYPSPEYINIRSNEGKTALYDAARSRYGVCVKQLIDLGADVTIKDENGRSALPKGNRRYSENGEDLTVQFPVECGVNVTLQDSVGRLPIHEAWLIGSVAKAKFLVNGSDLATWDRNSKTVLHEAAKSGTDTFLRLLLKRGSNPNIKDKDGQTKLEYAKSENERTAFSEWKGRKR
jgi:hypothetical protein